MIAVPKRTAHQPHFFSPAHNSGDIHRIVSAGMSLNAFLGHTPPFIVLKTRQVLSLTYYDVIVFYVSQYIFYFFS
jgi:hypothetical protein